MKGVLRLCSFFSVAVFLSLFESTSAQAQPAPGLSEMWVYAVSSPGHLNGTWDYQSPGAMISNGNHGGSWLRVAVFERGYARGQRATFNGQTMRLYHSEPLTGSNRRIYGWIRHYEIRTNFTTGRFAVSATSIAQPWGTRSVGLNIR